MAQIQLREAAMNTKNAARNVVVLGINGHLGAAVASAFVEAGWNVSGFGRSNKHKLDGVRFVQGDADDVGSLRKIAAKLERGGIGSKVGELQTIP